MSDPPIRDTRVPLLRTEKLTRHFTIGNLFSRANLHAVDNADLVIHEREIVALAGESGSGKSTIARLLAMVYKPTSGEIYFRDKPLSSLRSRKDVLGYRSEVPMVFQDPFASLNPAHRISHGIMRTLKLHRPELDAQGRAGRSRARAQRGRAHPGARGARASTPTSSPAASGSASASPRRSPRNRN